MIEKVLSMMDCGISFIPASKISAPDPMYSIKMSADKNG